MLLCRRSIAGLLLAAALLAAPAVALAQTAPVAAGAPSILVYNAQHPNLTQAWADGFSRESGVKVTLRNGGDTELGNQIVQEGAASPADVFLTENSPAMALVDAAGLFAPLGKDVLSLVPDYFRSADGRWVGVAARTTVFAYNKNKLTPAQLPKSLLDLADPSWKGRWAASPAGADFQAIVGAMLELKGEAATAAWLKAMKQNATAYQGNGAAMKAVNAGEIEVPSSITTITSAIRPRPGKTATMRRCTTSGTRTRAPSSVSRAAACWRPASIRRKRRPF